MTTKSTPSAEIHLNTKLIPVLLIPITFFYLINAYRGLSIFLVGLGGVWLISYLWARSLAQGLSLRREMRFGWAQVGDRLEERFTLKNDSSFPATWVEVLDQSDLPDYHASQVRVVDWHTETRWQVSGLCKQRGLFTLGPTRIHTGDAFGIYSVYIDDLATATLMVTPPVVPLPKIRVAPGGRVGEGVPRVDAPERTVSAVSVREYIPGDSLRWIHWPTSAHRGEYFVRIFEGAPAGDWWILLDLDKDVQAGDGANSTLEHSIILAASLADQGMHLGKSVGLIATSGIGDEEELIWLSPQLSDDHRWEILRALALARPNQRPLMGLLELSRLSLPQHTSLIVITASMDSKWLEGLLSYRRRGVVPTVLLFDTNSFGVVQSVHKMQDSLTLMGIPHELITSDLLDRREAQPGREGHWEWKVTPLGKTVAAREPHDLSWREL